LPKIEKRAYLDIVRQRLAIAVIAAKFLLASSAAAVPGTQKIITLSDMGFGESIVVSLSVRECLSWDSLFVFRKNEQWQVSVFSGNARSPAVIQLSQEEVRTLDTLLDRYRAPRDYSRLSNAELISLVHYRFGEAVAREEFYDRTGLSEQQSVNFHTILAKARDLKLRPALASAPFAPLRALAIFLIGAGAGGFVIWRFRPAIKAGKASSQGPLPES
jgi:hypothetical protein